MTADENADRQRAGEAVQRFCSQSLHLPGLPIPRVLRVGACSSQLAGGAHRPATAVAAQLPEHLWHKIREAKRSLPRGCVVSIDKERTREECLRRRAQRQQQREGQVGGHEGQNREEGAAGVEAQPPCRDQ